MEPIPWPAGEVIRTPYGALTPPEWWSGLSHEQQRRWKTILQRLTPGQRQAFHDERRDMALELPIDAPISFSAAALHDAEKELFDKWRYIALSIPLEQRVTDLEEKHRDHTGS